MRLERSPEAIATLLLKNKPEARTEAAGLLFGPSHARVSFSIVSVMRLRDASDVHNGGMA